MIIYSYNVNSIRARHDRFLEWLKSRNPDVVCLQEIKTTEKDFPFDDLKDLGYHAAISGQKTYNGVAIVSRGPIDDIRTEFISDPDDDQARYISGRVGGIRVASIYVPNGKDLDSPKYPYKLGWLDRLIEFLGSADADQRPAVICGDYNIAPTDADIAFPEKWNDSVLCTDGVRERLQGILAHGYIDTFRALHPEESGVFSWWDYRQLAFPKGNGLRIDFVLAAEGLRERLVSAGVDRDERKGKKPSDHAPVYAEFRD